MKIIHEIINRGKGSYGLGQNQLTRAELLRIYDETRSITSLILTTSGTTGPATFNQTTGVLNIPNYTQAAVSGFVPYTGATANVNLGDRQLIADAVQFNLLPTALPAVGKMKWNADAGTMDIGMGYPDVVQQVGMETYYPPVKNQTGSAITNGTVVMAVGTLGSSGRILIAPAVADGSVPSRFMLGITTHDIPNGGDGVITWFGLVRGFNTVAKAPAGETWADGDVLWINPAVPGGLTKNEPSAPNIKVSIALIIHAATNGSIMVRPSLGMRLTDLHDVNAFTPSTNDLLVYNSVKWEPKSLTSLVGAGLSLDSLNRIQLGNDGAGVINISDTDLFSDGFTVKYNQEDSEFVFDNSEYLFLGQDLEFTIETSNSEFERFRSSFQQQNNYFGVQTFNQTDEFTEYSTEISTRSGGVNTDLLIQRANNNLLQKLHFSDEFSGSNKIVLTDQINSKGLEYAADYSANWTDHSLVTKSWVLGQISGSAHNPVTINPLTPNGLSIDPTTQVLTIGLASASATGALSSTDWNTFNDKIGGSIASGQVAFGSGSGTINGSNNLIYSSGILNIQNEGLTFINTAYSQTASLIGRRANGTMLSPSALLANELIGGILVRGYNGVDFTSTSNAGVFIASSENWSTTANGTYISFETTSNGTTSRSERLRITDSGLVGINTSLPSNTLDVNGTARIRSISNLGTSATNILVPNANGVLSVRTASELRSDIGAFPSASLLIASTQIAFGTGTNTIGGSSNLTFDSTNVRLSIGGSTDSISQVTFTRNSSGAAIRVLNLINIAGTVNSGVDLKFTISADPTSGAGAVIRSVRTNAANSGDSYLAFLPSLGVVPSEVMRINPNGQVWINTTSGTNTLDVNGTARIRTISNLGTAATEVLVPDATGVMSKRTRSEFLNDMLSNISGFNASATQVLRHASGVYEWVNV